MHTWVDVHANVMDVIFTDLLTHPPSIRCQVAAEQILPQPLKKVRIRSKFVNRQFFTKLLSSDDKTIITTYKRNFKNFHVGGGLWTTIRILMKC